MPGDVIATGTPDGVGHRRTPPLWMKPGDVLEVEISGIGTLRNRVVDETVDAVNVAWAKARSAVPTRTFAHRRNLRND